MSKIEVDAIDKQSGSTLTIGGSGTAVTLACGATQTGFGRTGTVDWDTTPKTATFTAVSGDGFFCNTTGGAFTANLPAGAAGAIVSFADYAGTWQTNALTVSPNGSDKIGGINANITLSTEGQSVTFIFVDSTQGWINVQDSTSNERATEFVAATGGTETTSGNFKIHTFTGPGTFTVTAGGSSSGSNTVDYLVIGGGAAGGGGGDGAGGGGAGGYRFSNGTASGCYAAGPSPLGASALPVVSQAYPITVGGGGSPNPGSATSKGGCGVASVFSTITSTGGGSGGLGNISPAPGNKDGNPGGSGGGGGTFSPGSPGQGAVGSGNTPSVSPPQGENGGTGATDNATYRVGGGGGGAGATGVNVCNPAPAGGVGGAGLASSINGTPTTRAGGGGGGGHPAGTRNGGAGGAGGGGNGARYGGPPFQPATAATVNTGSGGGGSGYISAGTNSGAGGSGLIIIRYKFQ